jgi:protein-disulfide isomerase
MSRFYLVLGIVAVIGIGAVGFSMFSSVTSSAATAPIEIEGIDDPATLISLATGTESGNPDAQVAIWEFADYQCPACQVFAGQVKPQIDLAYVETGQVKMIFFDFPLAMHPNAFIAARAARCAGDQERYWDFHDELFRQQQSWSTSANPARDFQRYAKAMGMDEAAFRGCVDSDRFADVVTANMHLGNELRVNGTPTIMVVREGSMPTRVIDFSWPSVQKAVEEALAQ